MKKETVLKESGFTLVELAIVMIIIGLLIGGILKGQELVENARITALTKQLTEYKAAFYTFKDKYGAVPGDIANAPARIPGCNAGNFCVGGDGSGFVGLVSSPSGNQTGNLALPQVETSMFWKHLVLSGLISGVNPNISPESPAWGQTHPASKLRGGYHIFHSTRAGDYGIGHVLRLQMLANQRPGSQEGDLALTPSQAERIDRKMDDGLPDSGIIAADYAATECDRGVFIKLVVLVIIAYFIIS